MKIGDILRNQIELSLTTQFRKFIIQIDNVWRLAEGVYVRPLVNPFIIKCVYNGKFHITNSAYFDCFGRNDEEIEYLVIEKNLTNLLVNVKPKKKKVMVEYRVYTPRATIPPDAFRFETATDTDDIQIEPTLPDDPITRENTTHMNENLMDAFETLIQTPIAGGVPTVANNDIIEQVIPDDRPLIVRPVDP